MAKPGVQAGGTGIVAPVPLETSVFELGHQPTETSRSDACERRSGAERL
jgi:hypothetical protein